MRFSHSTRSRQRCDQRNDQRRHFRKDERRLCASTMRGPPSWIHRVSEKKLPEKRQTQKIRDGLPNEDMPGLPNVIHPHLRALTMEAEDNCAVMAVEETMDYIENGNITNSSISPACHMGACCGAKPLSVVPQKYPRISSLRSPMRSLSSTSAIR